MPKGDYIPLEAYFPGPLRAIPEMMCLKRWSFGKFCAIFFRFEARFVQLLLIDSRVQTGTSVRKKVYQSLSGDYPINMAHVIVV